MHTNQIILGDAYEYVKNVADNSVDLILIDPPYLLIDRPGGGITSTRKGYVDLYSDEQEDSFRLGIKESLLDDFRRIQPVENLYIFCNTKMLPFLLNYYKNDKFDVLVYQKDNPIPTFKYGYLKDIEYIVYVCNDRNKLTGDYHSMSKVLTCKKEKNKFDHPAPKPLPIIKTLIKNSSQKGDLVLDCFMGTGTTARACLETQRRFIGCEKNKKYWQICQERIKSYTIDLF